MKKHCLDCGQQFEIEPSENYKTLCKSCFIESKKTQLEELQNEVIRLECENFRLKDESTNANNLKQYRAAKADIERLERRNSSLELQNTLLKMALDETEKENGISPNLLKRLKQLCHPDKHGGSQLSTAVFSELNRF